jgi:hypothetical protein
MNLCRGLWLQRLRATHEVEELGAIAAIIAAQ